jgi:hypothetical protein
MGFHPATHSSHVNEALLRLPVLDVQVVGSFDLQEWCLRVLDKERDEHSDARAEQRNT